jgi:hypothetical protein
MLRFATHERNAVVAALHDAAPSALQAGHSRDCARVCTALIRRAETFSTSHPTEPNDMVIVMMSGAKDAPASRKRRIVPNAERRLRTSFPEVWAWYELLVAARGAGDAEVAKPPVELRRSSGRR